MACGKRRSPSRRSSTILTRRGLPSCRSRSSYRSRRLRATMKRRAQSLLLEPKFYSGEDREVRGGVTQADAAFCGQLDVLGQLVFAAEAQVERALLGPRDRRRPVD